MADSSRNREFEPTHDLTFVGTSGARAEVDAANAALAVIFEHADRLDLWLDAALLGDDHPEVLASLREAFEPVDDEHLRGPVSGVPDDLWDLLAMTSIHRFVSLERLEASREGAMLVRHVPDHHVFVVDVSPSEDLLEDLRDAMATEAGCFLPAETLAEWTTAGGNHYELSPPSICIDGDGCLGLSGLADIRIDEDRREIRLVWSEPEGITGRLSAGLRSLLGPDRPHRFRFRSDDRFREVAAAFEPIADALS